MIYIKKLSQFIVAFLISYSGLNLAAETSSTKNLSKKHLASITEEEPRWFEVEIILFKPTSTQGLLEESWNSKVDLTKSENLIDFLQPHRLIPGDIQNLPDDALPPVEEEITQETTNNTPQETDTTLVNNLVDGIQQGLDIELTADAKPEEKPFQLLADELLQLKNEAASLKRHPDYKLLTHLAWRQPVLGQREAPHIRIAAGQDFGLEYDYQGNKLMTNPNFGDDSQPGMQDGFQGINSGDDYQPNAPTTTQQVETYAINQPGVLHEQKMSEDSAADDQNKMGHIDQIVPTIWVPELDGDIKIYLGRYLHIKTNLFLRRPDKEEIEAIDLDVFDLDRLSTLKNSTELLGQSELGNSIINSSEISDASQSANSGFIDSDILKSEDSSGKNHVAGFPTNPQSESNASDPFNFSQPDDHQFSWEIDDNFLEAESEKMYIERLFNYRLKQSRRVRSGELHYFDHPLIGMLVIIRPYEMEEQQPPDALGLPPSI
ncbi:CsiV family protein [Aliikangiella coralliicola]|uniref:Peptidoglycan-binding protein CsiV n=1 Tax=Aliikangiella coralliicola TaxID=2592383 RepID=A0A545U4K3_9GAMM|nr:CsiV family protein [Aliikangiella coralliicola]TQV84401.1 hypothetical protein FLL46_22535 [Aliikangiella coralliicola]